MLVQKLILAQWCRKGRELLMDQPIQVDQHLKELNMIDAPAALLVIKWLVRDTFRQARASGIFWLMLGITGLCVLLCLSLRIEGEVPLTDEGVDRAEALPRSDVRAAATAVATLIGNSAAQSQGVWSVPAPMYSREYQQVQMAFRHNVPVIRGQMTLAFGAVTVELSRDRLHAVRSLQCILAGWVADAAGLLLALLWTAGFLPAFLAPAAVSVLLAKPVPRWTLLAGKFIGVLTFVAFQSFVFLSATWLALGIRTGVWDLAYFICLPILLLHFGVFFSFSTVLAVVSRNSVICSFGSIVFWLICWAMNYGRHTALTLFDLSNMPQTFGFASELGYWVFPKPLDFHILLVQTLNADNLVLRVVDLRLLTERGGWTPEFSVLASLMTAVALLAMAMYEFVQADY